MQTRNIKPRINVISRIDRVDPTVVNHSTMEYDDKTVQMRCTVIKGAQHWLLKSHTVPIDLDVFVGMLPVDSAVELYNAMIARGVDKWAKIKEQGSERHV